MPRIPLGEQIPDAPSEDKLASELFDDIDLMTGEIYGDNTNPAFNPSDIQLTIKDTYFVNYNQSGVITITEPDNQFGQGASFIVLINADGNDINLPSDWAILRQDTPEAAKKYTLIASFDGTKWYASLVETAYSVVLPDPEISGGTITDNTYIDVSFNTGEYGADDGSTPVALSDLVVTFAQNGGTATAWTATTATKTTGGALTGGETVIRINGSATGIPDGNETLTVTPADGSSLFNADGVAMADTETTGAVSLVDESLTVLQAPVITGIVVDSSSALTVNFTDPNSSPTAESLTLQYDTDSNFGSPSEITGIAAGNGSQQITGLTEGTLYYARMVAVGDGTSTSNSGFSNVDSATTDIDVVQLDPLVLDSLTVDSSTAITINYTDPNTSPTATSLTFEYDTDAGFSSPIQITGVTAGSGSEQVTGLIEDTQYYFRGIAIGNGTSTSNSVNSNVLNATTDSGIVAPTVTTQAVSDIGDITATGNGNITDLGGENAIAHGVVYSTSPNPTLSDSVVDNGAATSTGAFTANITGLTAETTYYVRAFAINTQGVSYGDQVQFDTAASVNLTDLTIATNVGYDVTGTTYTALASAWNSSYIYFNETIASNEDFIIAFKYPNLNQGYLFGVKSVGFPSAFVEFDITLYFKLSSPNVKLQYLIQNSIEDTLLLASNSPTKLYGLRRVGSTWDLVESNDNGLSWGSLFTFTEITSVNSMNIALFGNSATGDAITEKPVIVRL